MASHLLAKSWKPGQGPIPTLAWHTSLVMDAAERLLRLRARNAIDAAGLPQFLLPLLERIVRFAAWWHDVGKCMEHFQRMLKGPGAQPFRHEAVSWYLALSAGPLRDHLASLLPDEEERWMVAACVSGHHRKFFQGLWANGEGPVMGTSRLLFDHPDFAHWLDLALGASGPAYPRLEATILTAQTLARFIEEEDLALDEGERDIGPLQARILSLAKSFLISADMAGSALPRAGQSCEWIDSALNNRASAEERLTLLRNKVAQQPLRPFQEGTASSTAPWTFLKAGCGMGKTAAACAWGAKQHTGRQLWLTYPTTGTATEGFKDYVLEADLEGALLHSRAELDLEMFGTPEDSAEEFAIRDLALRGWAADTVTATVDTVLGIIHNQRAGHYAFPGLCHAALVFDELHAYDARLFGCLLRFLEAHPGIPCLFMTASLPTGRFEALNRLCQRLHGTPLPLIPGPVELETLPRYRIASGDPWEAVVPYMESRGKVLWVSNTVSRATQTADIAEGRGWAPLRYHSRYRYLDRLDRHQEVIQSFASYEETDAALACTTQVAEMSLDLSADLLITDLAPVAALIQRLGRLNRRAEPGAATCPFIVLEPETAAPYTEDELIEARAWLIRLGAGALSQKDLVDAWMPAAEIPEAGHSYLLDETLWTRPGSIREASRGVTVILEEDFPRVHRREHPASAYLISMPPRQDILKRLFRRGGYLVAPPGLLRYDAKRGAEWL